MFTRLRSFVMACLRRDRFEAGMDDELQFHIDAYAGDLMRSGIPRAEAVRRARLQLGAVETIKEECRQTRGLRLLDEVRQDLRYTVRMMAKTPVFTAAAILSLALGIGANTAILSLMDAVLFRTLPIENPGQLYFLAHSPGPNISTSSNYPLFERYRTAPVFSGVTAYQGRTFRVRTTDGLERMAGQFVSGNYHKVLGARMLLGWGFSSDPDRRPGASLSAVISHDYWNTRYGRDPDVIGKTLTIGNRTVSIVGVTAAGFHGLSPGGRVDITLPMAVLALDTPEFLDARDGWVGLVIVGRLAPGVREEQALTVVDLLLQQFLDEPESRWVRAATRDGHRSAALVPAARGTWALRTQYAKPLWLAMAMVGIVLLMACANIANLLLARARARAREIAVRLSIGAGRRRLVRQLLTESLVLALCGGAAGIMVAIWGTDAILSLFAVGPSPLLIDTSLNVRVLAFTAAVVVLTGIGFGVVPAFRSTRLDLAPALKDGAVTLDGTRGPTLGRALVVAQIALCVLIVTAAGLLARSLGNLQSFNAGFDRENILLADVDAAATTLSPGGRVGLYSDLLERLRALPGVRSASLSTRSPIDFSSQVRRIDVPGVPVVPGQGVSTNMVTPEYFETFGIHLIQGRGFAAQDRQNTPRVALVSESMARFYFGSSDPIGRTFQLGGGQQKTTIVGVVEDVRHERLRLDVPPKMIYTLLAQRTAALDGTAGVPNQLTVTLRTNMDPGALASTLRNEVRAVSKDVMVPYLRTMNEQIDAALVPEQLLAMLSTGFAVVALLLACIGLYGVMAYNVTRRTREIGIRMALGALPRTVLYRVLRETFAVSTMGVALGSLIALAVTRALSTFLFGLTPHDPATLLGTGRLLLLVSLVAGFLPARHAATVDPVRVLRNE
jgi:putative ABC transport system permease protein